MGTEVGATVSLRVVLFGMHNVVDDAFIMNVVRVRLKCLRTRVRGFLTDSPYIPSVSQHLKMLFVGPIWRIV